MNYTPKIEKALKVAARLHQGQLRKSDNPTPYITHPVAVAMIVSGYTDDENTIVSALLHDTVEDCDYTPTELKEDFGSNVLAIVMGVTEQKNDTNGDDLPWKIRKEAYISGLSNDRQESLLICAADKIHNMQNKLDDSIEDGPGDLNKFQSTPEERLWYHKEVLSVLKRRLKRQGILKKYQEILLETEKVNRA